MPAWCRLSARLSPAIPPPTTMTSIPDSPGGGADVLDRLEGRDFDVLQFPVHLIDSANVNVVHHVAGHPVDHHGAARAFPRGALHGGNQLAAVRRALGVLERLIDEVHAVVSADG